jgi:amino acid adenylation domain-containing protein
MRLSDLVEQSAQQDSDHAAYRIDGEQITYGELAQRSSQLAHFLMDLGIRKGDRVGIFLNKSLETAIAISGIWKAGAAFVPIDPVSPAPRVQNIIDDCGIRILIADPARKRVLGNLTRLQTVIGLEEQLVDSLSTQPWSHLDGFPAERPTLSIGADDLAYIMYTSGSTGLPKGLMHTHHSGMSYARLSAATYDVRPQDILTNHSPLHFDMSTFEYLTAPLCGATTVIVSEATSMFPTALSELIEQEQVTFWYSVPLALVQMLLRGDLAQRNLTSIRWVLYGGEPFPIKHLRALMNLWPRAQFSNVYGPAEVNQCTYFHIPSPPASDSAQIPIGKTWDETEHRVMDTSAQPLIPGNPGELWIASSTMMQAYWQRPELNEKAFREIDGKRYYRTGDLVEEQSNGTLMFLGRLDRQIKSRGYRVELDEVEAAILTHPDVEAAAVITLANEEDNTKQIVASVVLSGEADKLKNVIRHTAEQVPPYALPEQWHIEELFPKTGSGKVDRNALANRYSRADT